MPGRSADEQELAVADLDVVQPTIDQFEQVVAADEDGGSDGVRKDVHAHEV